MMSSHTLGETLIAIEHVDAVVGGTAVLRDLDVAIKNIIRPDVAQGQVVGVLGPSGIGKTTLLRLLAGLDPPTRGRVLVTSPDGQQVPVRPGMVGVVHQTYPLFEHRSVLGNLLVAARCGGASRDRAMALLERFGLAERSGAWPGELSGGQRQRVAIAQQLVRGHVYVLMDEPFSGLDPSSKAKT
jgi:NitT/TauT family transport system ATP-binding protein